MGNSMVLLLLPFLAIGVLALLFGLATLKVRRRSVRTDQVAQPERDWEDHVPLEPLRERPVDVPHGRRRR